MRGDTIYYYPIRTDLSIIYNFHRPCTIKEYHCHNSYEILIPSWEGGLKCCVNNQGYEADKGDVFIIPPRIPHKVDVPAYSGYEWYVIYFRKEYMCSFSPLTEKLLSGLFLHPAYDALYIHLEEERMAELVSLIEKNGYYLNTPGYAQEIYTQHAFFEILLLLSKEVYDQNSVHGISRNMNYFKMKDVLTYVYSNFSQDLSLNHLTARFYISKTYLNNMFKLHTGFTVNQYIISVRIDAAKKLLQKGIPVSQIYEQVGFHNYSHFIRTFKKIVGISPKQYTFKFTDSNIGDRKYPR